MERKHYLGGTAFILAGILSLLAITLYSPPSSAAPSVAWTPDSVTQDVTAGQSVTVPLSFTASKNLTDVVVRVVPELEPYVSVDPIAFGDISKGETRDLTLTIQASADAQAVTVEGTIQLRRGSGPNKNYARPLPVTVNILEDDGGEVFEDPQGNYSIIVPEGLTSDYVNNEGLLKLTATGNDTLTVRPAIFISVDSNPTGFGIEDYYDGDPGTDLMERSGGMFSLIDVSGTPAYEFVPFQTFAGDVFVIIPQVDKFIVVHDFGASFQVNGLFQDVLDSMELGD